MTTLLRRFAAILILSTSLLFGDSLLNKNSNPNVREERPRPVYDYRLHDTVIMKVSYKDTIEFTKKQDTDKKVSLGAKIKSFITDFKTAPARLPNVEVESESQYETEGRKKDEKKVTIQIPSEIVEILPNGDLVLDAARTVMNGEDTATVRIGGRVNPKFVRMVNGKEVISSEDILELNIKTDASGPLSENERRGFITKFFQAFSPF